MTGVRRRELLLRGAALGVAATGVGAAGLAPAAVAKNSNPDVATVESFVRMELTAAAVYDALARLALDAATVKLLSMLAKHEREHAAVLLNAAEYLGGPPVKPPSPEELRRSAPTLARARTRHDALATALTIERIQLGTYYNAQQALLDTKLLQQTSTIMCSEGQHAVLVRSALGTEPIPGAFELGVS